MPCAPHGGPDVEALPWQDTAYLAAEKQQNAKLERRAVQGAEDGRVAEWEQWCGLERTLQGVEPLLEGEAQGRPGGKWRSLVAAPVPASFLLGWCGVRCGRWGRKSSRAEAGAWARRRGSGPAWGSVAERSKALD